MASIRLAKYTQRMTKIGKGANIYLKFLNLMNAMEAAPTFPVLDSTEERLLNELAKSWASDQPVTVLETMGMDAEASPTTIHRRLKSLKKKGVIGLEMDDQDNRVKYVVPTQLAKEYFASLSRMMVAATKGTTANQ